MRLMSVMLALIFLALTETGGHASFSPTGAGAEIPLTERDRAQLSDDLKLLETVAGNWTPEWRHEMPKEDAVSLAKRTLGKIGVLLSKKEEPAGELLLLKGLAAHYAYNLDQKEFFDVAVESFREARKSLPKDCRPLWYLGNHYAKAADAEKGIPLLQQAAKECGDNLPVSFWEDYAYAALLAAMPARGQYALDRVRVKNGGVLTKKVTAVEEGVRRRLVPPVLGKEYEREEIWRFDKSDGATRLVNGMYGLMVDIPGNWLIAPFGVRSGRSGIGITLPKHGKWPPPLEVAVFILPASSDKPPEEVLRNFLAKAGPKRTFKSVAEPGVTAHEKFRWLESRQKKGSRIVAGVLRRPQPAYPGLLFETPHNIPDQAQDESPTPRYYAPVEQFTRLPGDLDYLIMIEGAPKAFDLVQADLEFLLRNLVLE